MERRRRQHDAEDEAAPGRPPGRLRRGVRWLFPPLAEWQRAIPAFVLAALSAGLLRLAYRPIDWSPLAFVALVPLFWGLRQCRPNMALWVGLLFGMINGYCFTGWITIVSRFNGLVWLGLPALEFWLGLHIAVALSVIVAFARRLPPWPALGLAMLTWAGMEWFKMTGALALPYGLLAHSQGGWPAMAQLVSLAGLPLLSALIAGVNLSLMETIAALLARYGQAGALSRLALMLALTIAAAVWGSGVVKAVDARYAGDDAFTLRVALLQPNIPQEQKFASYSADSEAERAQLQDAITAIQLAQIDELRAGEADLIVTPESTFTIDFFDAEELFQRRYYGGVVQHELITRARDLDAPIIAGANENSYRDADGTPTELIMDAIDPATERFFPGHQYYGGLWIFRPSDPVTVKLASDYRKVHLMPFGEKVPYLGLIPGFTSGLVGIGEFTAGELGPPLGIRLAAPAIGEEGREVRLGMTICFEDLFPYIHNHYARAGTQLYVNTTNDSWFDGSPGPLWHLENARWRCIETRVPMVRCTNTGTTAVIGPTGRILETLPAGERAILRAEVALLADPPRTLYARLGDWFGWLSLLGAFGALVALLWKERREE